MAEAPPRERGKEPPVTDLRKGDIAYVINSAENALSKVTVDEVFEEDGLIEVWNLDKNARQTFSRAHGAAYAPSVEFKNGVPHLITEFDWRARVLLTRNVFRKLGTDVQRAFSDFMVDPSPENGEALETAVGVWTMFAATNERRAIDSGSIQEYLFAEDPGKDRRAMSSKDRRELKDARA